MIYIKYQLIKMNLSEKAKKKRGFGDIKAICELTGLSRPTVSKALSIGNGSHKVISLINNFYK